MHFSFAPFSPDTNTGSDTAPQANKAMTERPTIPDAKLIQYINLKLAALGCPTCDSGDNSQFEEMSALLAHQREINRLLANYLCPADNRIQTFLYDFLQEAALAKLPTRTFVLDRYGLARAALFAAGP